MLLIRKQSSIAIVGEFRELAINNLPDLRVYFAPLLRCENPHYALHNSGFSASSKNKISIFSAI